VRTTEFPYYIAPFGRYNVAQEAVVPFLDQDVNLVISFGTAVGKTVLAECAFGYHLSTDPDCRVAYVSPYRSLGSEKYESWKENMQLSRYGVMLNTGDRTATDKEYERCRMAVITMESFDSKTRGSARRGWLGEMACVVYDEAHLIGTKGRGAAMESSMMRFTEINPGARLILLSATMSNARDIAKWVKGLNNKPTKCITSEWRPNVLETRMRVVEGGFKDKVEEAVRLVREGRDGEKLIVFVHSKAVGREIMSTLKKEKVRCAFHNASVSANGRKRIEEAFGDRMSGLDVIISTSTLGAGVNL
jgi:helicase